MRQHGYEVLLESDRLEHEIREAFIFRDHIWNVFYNFTDYIHARNELSGVRYNLNNSNLDNSSLSVDDGLDQQNITADLAEISRIFLDNINFSVPVSNEQINVNVSTSDQISAPNFSTPYVSTAGPPTFNLTSSEHNIVSPWSPLLINLDTSPSNTNDILIPSNSTTSIANTTASVYATSASGSMSDSAVRNPFNCSIINTSSAFSSMPDNVRNLFVCSNANSTSALSIINSITSTCTTLTSNTNLVNSNPFAYSAIPSVLSLTTPGNFIHNLHSAAGPANLSNLTSTASLVTSNANLNNPLGFSSTNNFANLSNINFTNVTSVPEITNLNVPSVTQADNNFPNFTNIPNFSNVSNNANSNYIPGLNNFPNISNNVINPPGITIGNNFCNSVPSASGLNNVGFSGLPNNNNFYNLPSASGLTNIQNPNVQTPFYNSQQQPSILSSSYKSLKLDRMKLKQFHGDINEWQPFWDVFLSLVHSNPELDNCQKLNYLDRALHGEGRKPLKGLKVTSDNYLPALQILHQRFGRNDQVIQSHLKQLSSHISIDFNVTGHNYIKNLWQFFDQVNGHVRSLATLGVQGHHMSTYICPILLSKLPESIRLEWFKINSECSGDINQFLGFLFNQFESIDRTIRSGGGGISESAIQKNSESESESDLKSESESESESDIVSKSKSESESESESGINSDQSLSIDSLVIPIISDSASDSD